MMQAVIDPSAAVDGDRSVLVPPRKIARLSAKRVGYTLSVLSFLAALLLYAAPFSFPLLPFFLAVLVSAWFAGRPAAALVLVAGTIAGLTGPELPAAAMPIAARVAVYWLASLAGIALVHAAHGRWGPSLADSIAAAEVGAQARTSPHPTGVRCPRAC